MQQPDSDSAQPVRVTENLWIALPDGTRLAARLWLPADADARPAPAILEYIPYRKRDGTRTRDEPMHGYFAAHGFAALRVDLRGSGDSEGLLADEYLAQEQDDALEVIAWIARQRWCNGAVAMMGKSWGGFNALQVAARRPPALKAVLAVCFTDDRYADDIHFKGGCLLNDNLWWGAIMLAWQARPPDPAVVGENWRQTWLQRLDALPFFPALWLAHPQRDAYWAHGSVCEDWSAIACPVFAVGGWADSYTNAVLRLLAHLQAPAQGLIGPWAHLYPHDGVPGPAIGFLQEALHWWRRWLTPGAAAAHGQHAAGAAAAQQPAPPKLRVWLETTRAPATTQRHSPGRWIAEAAWPSPNLRMQTWYLGQRSLQRAAPEPATVMVCTPQGHGAAAGEWMGTGVAGESPADQRIDDGFATLFDSAALSAPLAILGTPELDIELASDKPVAQLCVRLSEVLADGAATRCSYGVFNLTQHTGAASPAALAPQRRYRVRAVLDACAHEFAAGSRIRIALASTCWPLVWPAPEHATLTVHLGASALQLPLRQAAHEIEVPPFAAPERGAQTPVERLRSGTVARSLGYDLVHDEWSHVTESRGGLFGEGVLRLSEIDTTVEHNLRRELKVRGNDPLSARQTISQSYRMGRPGWTIDITTQLQMHCDAQHFYLQGELSACENGVEVRKRHWQQKLPRQLL